MIASFDVIQSGLALGLVVVAFACLFDRHLLRASALFVLFALLMSVSWWYLSTPWLALTELVLGVVLTGGSFFYALRAFPSATVAASHVDGSRHALSHRLTRALLALAWCMMIGVAIYYVMPEMTYSFAGYPLILASIVMAATAMGAFALHRHLLRRLLAFNIMGSGIFILLAGMAGTVPGAQLLISVGLTIAWLGTLLGVLLIRHLVVLEGTSALEDESDAARQAQ